MTAACTDSVCTWIRDRTGHEWIGTVTSFLVATPLRVLLIVLGAIIVRTLLRRGIGRLAQRAAEGTVPGVLAKGQSRLFGDSALLSERRRQRAATMASVLRSVTTGVVFTVAFVMILAELGLNIAPVLASAGIVGVAVGFGAQALVKDCLSGVFMILEDQYGVGDTVELGDTTGTVEAVGLRVTRLRSDEGTVWYVRNGEVLRVGNRSQGWSTAILDVPVPLGQDVAAAQQVILSTAQQLAADDAWRERVEGAPELVGIESVTGEAVTVRVQITCEPNEHLAVQRELRRRLLSAFDSAANLGQPSGAAEK